MFRRSPSVRRSGAVVAAAVLVLAAAGRGAASQEPAKPQNLKVLPKDIAPDSLRAIMGSFTRALGVRCDHCHALPTGQRPAPEDFAKDTREPKKVARVMLQMVAEINGRHLPATGRDAAELARVSCFTCHHGIARPVPIETELLDTDAKVGLDSAIAEYRLLRTRYYGSAAYDFSDGPLGVVAQRLGATASRRGDALRVLTVNLEYFPQSWATYLQMGQLQAAMGDTASAIASLQKSVDINPQPPMAKALLERLKKP